MEQTNEKIFKAYDIRGLYPEEINESVSFRIGQAVADYFFPTRVIIGRDHRDSSYPLFQAVSGGIMKQGADVVDIGVCTSPMFYFAVAKGDYEAGVMITASHNPYEYNGIKIVKKKAIPLGMDLGLESIRDIVLEGNFHKSEKEGTLKTISLEDDYVEYVGSFQKETIDSNLKIVFDSLGGPASEIANKVFEGKLQIININHGSDQSQDPNPLKPLSRKEAEDTVIARKADGAFLWDGDGDRFFVLDEKARLIPGHFVAAVLAEYILKKHPNEKVVCDLRLSRSVFNSIERSGGLAVISRVGHSYIKNKMRAENAIFGAEMSGHFYFRGLPERGLSDFYFDNGMMPAIYLLEIMSQSSKKISELFDPFFEKYFVSEEINLRVADIQKSLELIENAFDKQAESGETAEIIKLDGITVRYGDWWFNARPSNTEPVLRLVVEADTEEKQREKTNFLVKLLS